MRSSDQASKYEQNGDRDSTAFIVCPWTRFGYGKVNLVWGEDLPSLGNDIELHGFVDRFAS